VHREKAKEIKRENNVGAKAEGGEEYKKGKLKLSWKESWKKWKEIASHFMQ
jgi:hypothetical protein